MAQSLPDIDRTLTQSGNPLVKNISTTTPQAKEHRPRARGKDAEGFRSDDNDDGLLVSAVPLEDRSSLQHAR